MFNVNHGTNPFQMLGNPQNMMNQVISSPQFQKFVEENKNLSPEELCKKFNINPAILSLLK